MTAIFHRMEPNGPKGKGLEDWGGLPAEGLESGTPQQTGYGYLDEKATGMSAGVWACTPMTGKMDAWSVHEFMTLLEGSVTIVHKDGTELTVKAGESFFIPKGTLCQWKQPGNVKKYYVIWDDASGTQPKDAAKLRAVKVDTTATLSPSEGPDPKLVVGAQPKWQENLLFADPTGQWTVGLWSTTAYERKVIPFPRHELMHILSGKVTISDGKGREEVFKAGDTLFVPKGALFGWKCSEDVKKIYCIFLEKEKAAKSEAAE
ncbi:MAG: cupin domain-containing protein [Hyphomicrobiaceae bacterium]